MVDDIIEEPDNVPITFEHDNIVNKETQNDHKQQRIEELEQELLLYKERLRHEQLENERLHQQYELREQEDELGHHDLSFGQDQLNQHEELERERRNKSEGGTRKRSKSGKSKKSRRVRKSRK